MWPGCPAANTIRSLLGGSWPCPVPILVSLCPCTHPGHPLTRWPLPSRSRPAPGWPPRSSPGCRGSCRSCGRSRGPWWQQLRWGAPSGPAGGKGAGSVLGVAHKVPERDLRQPWDHSWVPREEGPWKRWGLVSWKPREGKIWGWRGLTKRWGLGGHVPKDRNLVHHAASLNQGPQGHQDHRVTRTTGSPGPPSSHKERHERFMGWEMTLQNQNKQGVLEVRG